MYGGETTLHRLVLRLRSKQLHSKKVNVGSQYLNAEMK